MKVRKKYKVDRLYRFLGIPSIVSAILIAVLPFIYQVYDNNRILDCQPFSIKGIDVKDNTPIFRTFLNTIKANEGVLILGSSETGGLRPNNYQHLLNRHYDLNRKFSVLAGAGRTAHIYFPVFLNNKSAFDGLKVLYFINPTYWRNSLNQFGVEYYDRYNSLSNVYMVEEELRSLDLWSLFALPFIREKEMSGMNAILSSYVEDYRRNFIDVYQEVVNDRPYYDGLSCVQSNLEPKLDSSEVSALRSGQSLENNVSKEFANSNMGAFEFIRESDFQMLALKGFNGICDSLNIEVTYFLGPYNAIFCKKYSPDVCQRHEETIQSIRNFLDNEGLSYIDGTDLSYVPGTFNDKQHHSEFGAWFIAEKIAKYYENID